jgi:hypothetical protein
MDKIEQVKISELTAAPFNPKERTEKRKLARLCKSIERRGIIIPIIISSDGFIADGHRRVACALILGLDTVPAIRRTESLSELWAETNSSSMSISPRQWWQAANLGLGAESAMPDGLQRHILYLNSILTEDQAKDIAERKSPYILQHAETLANYCQETTDEFIRALVLWLDKYGQRSVLDAIKYGNVDPEVIKRAILEDKPLRHSWSV